MNQRTLLYTLPDFGVGGGQTILLRTATALAAVRPDLRQIVVGVRGGPMLDQFQRAGLECRVLGSIGHGLHPVSLARLVVLVRKERVDAICSFNTPMDRTYTQLVGAITRTPVAIWFMSMAIPLIAFPPPRGRELAFLKRAMLRPLNRLSARRAGLVALSGAVAQSFADHLGLPVGRFAVVPPGLPDSFYASTVVGGDTEERDQTRESLGVTDADPLLLCVGMLIDLKGQQHLVPMMAKLRERHPNAVLLLVGEGENRRSLEASIREKGLTESVRLLGHRHDVSALLAASDCLISASRSEGFGMAVLEAMAAGKPVVAVHTPAFDEFAVADETAVFVSHQDDRLLADAVASVFGDEERCSAMGIAARSRAEQFRVEVSAERFAVQIDSLVG